MKELKFNIIYDNEFENLENLLIDAIVNYLKESSSQNEIYAL